MFVAIMSYLCVKCISSNTMYQISSMCQVFFLLYFSGFKTEELLVKNTTSIDWSQLYLSAIVFNVSSDNANELPHKIQYKLRPKAEPYNKSDTAGRIMASGWMTGLMFPSRTNQKDSVKTNFGWVPPGEFFFAIYVMHFECMPLCFIYVENH